MSLKARECVYCGTLMKQKYAALCKECKAMYDEGEISESEIAAIKAEYDREECDVLDLMERGERGELG